MRRVLGVTFHQHGRLHFLDPGDASYAHGEAVLFPAESGPEVCRCAWGPTETDWDDRPLRPCAGPASPADLDRDAANRARRAEIRAVAERLISTHGLAMTVVGVDFVDRDPETDQVAVVYFKAPQRVDFRLLLGDLARALGARIDLRQVGARDVAALVGGVALCGRELCCALRGPVERPLSTRLVRDQEAANQALHHAGACGRLKCCMAYEADAYADYVARAPGIGAVVATPAGEGVVSGYAMPAEALWVRTEEGLRAVPVADADVLRPPPEASGRRRGDTPATPRSPAEAPPAGGRRSVFNRRGRRGRSS